MIALVVFLCAGALASVFPQVEKPFYDLEMADQHFEEFIQKFNKQYAIDEEKQMRFEIFKNSLEHINQLNSKSHLTVYGITKFSDLTKEEIKMYHGFRPLSADEVTSCHNLTDSDVTTKDAPDAFDWRDHNGVTAVKDQGPCGSCWAFSAIANVEGQYAIKNGMLKQFSEQQLIDCDKIDGGCAGGAWDMAFGYMIDAGGVESESDYAYTASQGSCAFDKSNVAVKLSACNQYNLAHEDKIREVLFKTGPLSIALDADTLGQYTKGIVEGCPKGGSVNHAVLLVGYGTENGTPYWIVKNSWGSSWGENGYFRMQRGVNMCSIMYYGVTSSVIA